jgi:hypothetical protein
MPRTFVTTPSRRNRTISRDVGILVSRNIAIDVQLETTYPFGATWTTLNYLLSASKANWLNLEEIIEGALTDS